MRLGIRNLGVLALVSLSVSTTLYAQQATPMSDAGLALEKGDARALMEQAVDRIAISIIGQTRQYSESQAYLRLRQFFRAYPPGAFAWESDESQRSDWFATGRYVVRDSETTLRVYAHWIRDDSGWALETLHVLP